MAYDARVTAKTTASVDRRLRLVAALKRQSISRVLTAILDERLPTDAELAGQITEKASA
jgi:hypothetical protein